MGSGGGDTGGWWGSEGTHVFVADCGLPERAGCVLHAPGCGGWGTLGSLARNLRHAHGTAWKGLTREAVKTLDDDGAVALEAVSAGHAFDVIRLLRRRLPHLLSLNLPRRRRRRRGGVSRRQGSPTTASGWLPPGRSHRCNERI